MRLGTLLLTAIALTAGSAAYTSRGNSTEAPSTRSSIASQCMVSEPSSFGAEKVTLSELPKGEFEYVDSEYRLLLPPTASSRGAFIRIDEKVFRSNQGLMIHAKLGCQSGLVAHELASRRVDQVAPRIIRLDGNSMAIANRVFSAGHEGSNSFYRLSDLPPVFGESAEGFDRSLREEWNSYEFEKLQAPYHYALRLQRVTPSGIVEARIIYRNTEAASRAREVSRRIADAVTAPVI